MDADMMTWLDKKRRGAMADDETMSEVERISRLVAGAADDASLPGLDAQTPAAGGKVAGEGRKPLDVVTQSARAVRGGDDEGERAEPIADGMPADVDDPRASAQAQASRQAAQRMSDVFLSAAGIQPPARGADPYVSERDKMRDWVLKRNAASQRGEMTQLQSDRTAAYLEATRAAKERDAAARAMRAQQENDAAKLREAKMELEQLREERLKAEGTQRMDLEQQKVDLLKKKSMRTGTGRPSTQDRRQQMREDALKPRAGWEKIVPEDPAFRDTAQAKGFDDAAAAFEALKNHRRHAAHALEQLKEAQRNGDVKAADTALGVLNQQMGNISSKLRVAEGLNNSDAANHAIETMLSLQNGSVANFRNAINDGRLDAILDSAIDSASTNLDTLAASNNLRRAKARAPEAHGEGGETVKVRRKKDGAIKALPKEQAAQVLKSSDYEEVK